MNGKFLGNFNFDNSQVESITEDEIIKTLKESETDQFEELKNPKLFEKIKDGEVKRVVFIRQKNIINILV